MLARLVLEVYALKKRLPSFSLIQEKSNPLYYGEVQGDQCYNPKNTTFVLDRLRDTRECTGIDQ